MVVNVSIDKALIMSLPNLQVHQYNLSKVRICVRVYVLVMCVPKKMTQSSKFREMITAAAPGLDLFSVTRTSRYRQVALWWNNWPREKQSWYLVANKSQR